MRVCSIPGCPTLYPGKGRHCPTHTRQAAQQRGTRQARGYDQAHLNLRAQWEPQVQAGLVNCARCSKRISPGSQWDLGHHDTDRTRYQGPEHAHCNRSAGGQHAHT